MSDQIWSVSEGKWVDMEAREHFREECAAYWHDTEYRQFLTGQRARGVPAQRAIEALRQELGAMTRQEKRAAWEAKQEAWRQAREAKGQNKSPAGAGRPRQELSLAEAKATIAGGVLLILAKLERRTVSEETRALLDGMKKQLASW